ncbi:MAG: hypothetical protein AAFQ94_25330 [Bacteroidota bacterium]
MRFIPKKVNILIKTPINDFFLGRKFVFHHLQKCGGSSLKDSLESHFILKKDYSYNGESRISISKLRPYEMIVGHFEMENTQIFDRYPELLSDRNTFLFTMVREPLQLKISLFYYWKKRNWLEGDADLFTFLRKKNNYLSFLLGCSESNYKDVLSRYDFIGLIEKYEESLDILSSKINRKITAGQVVNASARDRQDLEIDDLFRKEFAQSNELDYKIYDYVEKQFFQFHR